MSNPYDNVSEKVSVLGPTLVFKGELTAEEDLVLKGRVEGSINHTASLKVGQEGSVKGNIRAKHITVDGNVEGDLIGTSTVNVRESARVKGNIYSPIVSLVEGAHFKGNIDMDKVEAQPEARPQSDDQEASEPKSRRKAAVGGQ
jgi:cytoskeletal protein CcmA (bactofilin family)